MPQLFPTAVALPHHLHLVPFPQRAGADDTAGRWTADGRAFFDMMNDVPTRYIPYDEADQRVG